MHFVFGVVVSLLLLTMRITATSPSTSCHLVFSINAGRSGSSYLSRVLNLHPDVDAGHERKPVMATSVLRQAKQQGLEATYQARKALKIPAIRRVMATNPGKVYAETSHLFAKTFSHLVMQAFPECRIDVIVLWRDFMDIACSFYVHGWQAIHEDWLIEPWSQLATLESIPNHTATTTKEAAQEADLIFWYIYDTAAKAYAFSHQYEYARYYPQLHLHTYWLEELQTAAQVNELFQSLGLEALSEELAGRLETAPVSTRRGRRFATPVIGRASNTKQDRGHRTDVCPRKWLQNRLDAFHARAQNAFVCLPKMPLTPPPSV